MRAPSDRPGPWLVAAFAAFCLAVLAANGTMIALAVATWPGLATVDAYQKGIAYNQALAAGRQQAALGWRAELAFTPQGERRGQVALRLLDASGQPLQRARVAAELVRPSQAGHDFAATLGAQGGGRYVVEAVFPFAGIWDVRLRAERGGKVHQLTRRVMVR